jgi:hypothetical protein
MWAHVIMAMCLALNIPFALQGNVVTIAVASYIAGLWTAMIIHDIVW